VAEYSDWPEFLPDYLKNGAIPPACPRELVDIIRREFSHFEYDDNQKYFIESCPTPNVLHFVLSFDVPMWWIGHTEVAATCHLMPYGRFYVKDHGGQL
jgi:hypothetical protein